MRYERTRSSRRISTLLSLLTLTVTVTPFCRADGAVASSQPATPPAPAKAPDSSLDQDLSKLNIEDLLNVEVTSVSRQKQKVSDAPAAVTVITQDDIRRSHLDSIPELLRLVPGLNVARISADAWAITSRGFNDLYANKLQVLIDGRSAYSPLFSGVFWDMQETLVQDLDRIEVIRGPGATLWGANAVNGVINVTGKSARDTQGFLFDGRYGEYEQRGAARYGGKIGDDTFFRVWGQYRNTNDFTLPDASGNAHDGWDALVGGFRLDKYATPDDTFTVIANAGAFREGETLVEGQIFPPFVVRDTDTFNAHGDNVLGRWTHRISDRSDFTLQVYYDHVDRDVLDVPYSLDVGDVDFQHRFPIGERQEVVWGAGYRYTADHVGSLIGPDGLPFATIHPSRRDDYIASAFIQDDVTVVKDRLHLLVGTKLEQNSYSGFEVQPTARLVWTPSARHTLWGAVSRAMRTPSRFEEDARINFGDFPVPPTNTPAVVYSQPNIHLDSEQMMAYELGYRWQATKTLSFDAATFFNRYSHLRSFETGPASFVAAPSPHLEILSPIRNNLAADSYGVELAANWKVTDTWRLAGSYSFITIDAHTVGSGNDTADVANIEGATPRNQLQAHSYLDLTRDLQFDASAYYVEAMGSQGIPSYVRVDLALTWTPKPGMDVTVGVQNLLDPHHPEFSGTNAYNSGAQIPRMVFAQLSYRF